MRKDEIFQFVKQHTCDVIPELEAHDFQLADSLAELGANSVERAEIVTLVMDSLSLAVPRVTLFGARTLGELVDVFYEKLRDK